MRDIIVTIIIFGTLPFILRRPFFGVMVWTWLGFMNPHRLAWGFAASFPFALTVFSVTAVAYVFSKEPRRIPVNSLTIVLLLFVVWLFITTNTSLFPSLAWEQWNKVWRIQLGVLLTLVLINSRERITLLVWTIVVSLGFYGFKGGIWTVMTGGGQRVYGPDGTFISGNNELGLALVMLIPFIWYLTTQTGRRWVRQGLYAGIFFSLIAIIGTHSRGALVGLLIMGLLFLMKAKNKIFPLFVAAIFALILPQVVPQEWFDRMHTIETYQEDESAQNRFRAWGNAHRLAQERFVGGGFESIAATGGTDAHSIYFEVLGEHGYVGLSIFLTLGFLTWLKVGSIRKRTRNNESERWATELGSMIQTSLAGYATAGAFLGMAYFDFLYVIIAIVIQLDYVTAESALKQRTAHSLPPAIGINPRTSEAFHN